MTPFIPLMRGINAGSASVAVLLFAFLGCTAKNTNSLESNPQSPGAARGNCRLLTDPVAPSQNPPYALETVVDGLETPWGIAFLPNGDWLVTERPGRVRLVRQGSLVPAPVIEIEVAQSGEGGLLGIARDPKFGTNRYFYLYYTDPTRGVNRVERYRLDESGTKASTDRVIVEGIPSGAIHNGGRLRFGPDGKLYIGTGDTRQAELAQDRKSLAGKILRVEPDGSVPSDNPFPGNPVFILGIRNTQAFDWLNPSTLVVMDHGPTGDLGRSGHDELNIAHAGENLGWPVVWSCEQRAGFVAPIVVWEEASPPAGAAFDQGHLFIGTLGSRNLQRVRIENGSAVEIETFFQGEPPSGFGRLREVIKGPDGKIYITTSNCDGRGTCGSGKDRILRLENRADTE